MKVKAGSEPVPGTPKVGRDLRSFGSRKPVPVPNIICSSLTTGFLRNNIIIIQLFWLIFFRLYFSVFFYIFFLLLSAVPCATCL
ncbi:hypothetical protein Hanom_Chr16g01476181 [Helianthus anomalus]